MPPDVKMLPVGFARWVFATQLLVFDTDFFHRQLSPPNSMACLYRLWVFLDCVLHNTIEKSHPWVQGYYIDYNIPEQQIFASSSRKGTLYLCVSSLASCSNYSPAHLPPSYNHRTVEFGNRLVDNTPAKTSRRGQYHPPPIHSRLENSPRIFFPVETLFKFADTPYTLTWIQSTEHTQPGEPARLYSFLSLALRVMVFWPPLETHVSCTSA